MNKLKFLRNLINKPPIPAVNLLTPKLVSPPLIAPVFLNQSAEFVGMGHPDKIADLIADTLLDYLLTIDKTLKVALEVFVTNKLVVIGGETSYSAPIELTPEIERIVKTVLKNLLYTPEKFTIINALNHQSANITDAVVKEEGTDLGAGDCGIVFGYATNETPQLMPIAYCVAREIILNLNAVNQSKPNPYLFNVIHARPVIDWLLPDAKCLFAKIDNPTGLLKREQKKWLLILVVQHLNSVLKLQILYDLIERIIKPVLMKYQIAYDEVQMYLNPNDSFITGGLNADTGLTNRKLMADSYGPVCKHGGGGYCGKDLTKTDRSGALVARYVAKNLVSAQICKSVTVKLVYVIGAIQPVLIDLDYILTPKYAGLKKSDLITMILKTFDLSVSNVVKKFNRVNFAPLAQIGHFGFDGLPWEDLAPAPDLKALGDELINNLKTERG